MTKKNFTDRLMDNGVGFALTFLVVLGLAMGMVLFGAVALVTYWWERIP